MLEGDVVFAPYRGCMWPSKILKINVMAEIKFFRVKENEKIPLGKLEIFNEASIAKYQS